MIEDVEELAPDAQTGAFSQAEVAEQVERDVVGDAGAAHNIAAFISKCPQGCRGKCRRIEIAKDIARDVERAGNIGALASATGSGAVPGHRYRYGEAAREGGV